MEAQPYEPSRSFEVTPTPEPTPSAPVAKSATSAPSASSTTPNSATPSALAADAGNVSVVIGFNNTSATNDDIVELGSTLQGKVRIENPTGQSLSVVLNNVDDRLDFVGQGADGYLHLTLPGDGSPVDFTVSGVNDSEAVADAVVHAHENNVYTPILGQKSATVYKFANAAVNVTTGSNYDLIFSPGPSGEEVAFTTVDGGPGVRMYARVNIVPAGLDVNTPQLQHLWVGMTQNVYSNKGTIRESTPYVASWSPSVPSGDAIQVASALETSGGHTDTRNDATALTDPLYDKPGVPNGPAGQGTISADSLKRPLGLVGGDTAFTLDLPQQLTFTEHVVQDTSNNVLAVYKYRRYRAFRTANFRTWAVLYNDALNQIRPLRQKQWSLALDSSRTGEHANTRYTEQAPTTTPVVGPPYPNSVSVSTGAAPGSSVVTLRKP